MNVEPLIKIEKLEIHSPAFGHKELIPSRYTCDGENVNPALTIGNIPEGTKSMAVVVVDPDSSEGTFDHWLIWNISPDEMILENSAPGTEGKNSFGNIQYEGPCPQEGKEHHYLFKVYALDTFLDLLPGTHRKTLEEAMKDHIIGGGEITGIYSRSKTF